MKAMMNQFEQKFESIAWLGVPFLRVMMGALMLVHGYPKLLRLFEPVIKFPDPLGVGVFASLLLTVFSEFFCSILLIIGFKTRLASIPLIITMFFAAFIIHSGDAWKKKELGVMYLVGYMALLLLGSGKLSIDNYLERKSS